MVDLHRRRQQVDRLDAFVVKSSRWCRCEHARLPLVVLASTRQSGMTLLLPLDSPKVPEVLVELRIPQQHVTSRKRSESRKTENQKNPKHHSDRAVLTR